MKKRIAWALCLIWMGVIFAMSAMPGDVSGQQSGFAAELTAAVLSLLGVRLAPSQLPALELLIRKAAHMAEYAVLFLLYHRALRISGAKRPGAAALILCAAYAVTDEFHQIFIENRGPSPIDVMIDTAGAAIAWLILFLLRRVSAPSPSSRRRSNTSPPDKNPSR